MSGFWNYPSLLFIFSSYSSVFILRQIYIYLHLFPSDSYLIDIIPVHMQSTPNFPRPQRPYPAGESGQASPMGSGSGGADSAMASQASTPRPSSSSTRSQPSRNVVVSLSVPQSS